jgi:hypothetical protein
MAATQHNGRFNTARNVRRQTVLAAEGIHVEYLRAHTGTTAQLAFTFTPLENFKLDDLGYAGAFLLENGFDVIAFKSVADDWFQSLPAQTFQLIDQVLVDSDYQRRVAYGSSMGGFAAIQFSSRLACDLVLALSPQGRLAVDGFDARWREYWKHITCVYEPSGESIRPDCKYFLVYDNHDLDKLHVDFWSEFIPPANFFRVELPFSGHPVTQFLHEVGQLKTLTRDILISSKIPERFDRIGKRQSSHYLWCLAEHLLRRKKPKLCLDVIGLALQQKPAMAELYLCRSFALERLGLADEAWFAAIGALACGNERPEYRTRLDHLRGKTPRLLPV